MGKIKTVEMDALTPLERYAWMIHSVVPRPVAWITTLNDDNSVNCAPFSFFNAVAATPPLVMVAIGKRKGVPKDTARNIFERSEFVVHICPFSMAKPLVATSADLPYGESEIDYVAATSASGGSPLQLIPSDKVRVPGIAGVPLRMECVYFDKLDLGEKTSTLIFGEVLAIQADESALNAGGLPDPAKLDPLARLGGKAYARLADFTDIARPSFKPQTP